MIICKNTKIRPSVNFLLLVISLYISKIFGPSQNPHDVFRRRRKKFLRF